jgi:transcriptional regulator with XRE-family HTH domain
MPERPPIRSTDELASADADRISRHIAFELRQLLTQTGMRQLAFAQSLGYESAGGLSRWLNGQARLSKEGAKRLDDRYSGFPLYLTCETFTTLHERMSRSPRFTQPTPAEYDVFLASPMESVRTADGDGYETERSGAKQMVSVLMAHCGFKRIFYAGHTIEKPTEWESPDHSLEKNVSALHEAAYFVLLALTPPPKPSGIYVEAGLALALGKPSIYFVGHESDLPWMLRSVDAHRSKRLPRVSIQPVEGIDGALGRVYSQGRELFTRLDEN